MASLCPNCRQNPITKLELCDDCLSISVIVADGIRDRVLYTPQPHQQLFHESDTPNLLALGTRGTGKSMTLRWDAIIRCLMFPGFRALILRRKLTDLRKSHLVDMEMEAKALGANYRQTFYDVKFPNGSFLQFSHCEDNSVLNDYLSSQWDYIGFDEVSTFSLDQFLKICAAARSIVGKPFKSLVRCCSNPLGPGALWMRQWFVDKVVDYSLFDDYNPLDYEMQFSTLDDNRYVSRKEYEARLKVLPEHVRRAWLYGEFVVEGTYFTDYHKNDKEGNPWHVIPVLPTWKGQSLATLPWISVFRAIDWGYYPDPAVCLWIAMLPNQHAIVFMQRKWLKTLAKDVARDIVRLSEGMHILETFCDPTMFIETGAAEYSIGETFETNGVPLTASENDRMMYGYAIHEKLNTIIDGHPALQIVEGNGSYGCPDLIRTLAIMEMDEKDPRKIADGEDHFVVALAYFAMGKAMPTQDPQNPTGQHRWMMPKRSPLSELV
jgi:hypothetical protein